MRKLPWRRVKMTVIGLAAGTCFAMSSCSVQGIGHYLANYNPCGTILYCDPVAYNFVNSGYEGPGADPDVDPFCTYPPYCSSDVDPLDPGYP
jgi:hypothetical protein